MTSSPAVGKWTGFYAGQSQRPYDDEATYHLGARFLQNCREIEDWGCGFGWFGRTFANYSTAPVLNLDGSASAFVHKVVDLSQHQSRVEGIFLRGVLEHNHDWQPILRNALASFTKKMVLVCFTPFAESSRLLYDYPFADGGTVPVLSLPHAEIVAAIRAAGLIDWREEGLLTATEYGAEHVFYLTRSVSS